MGSRCFGEWQKVATRHPIQWHWTSAREKRSLPVLPQPHDARWGGGKSQPSVGSLTPFQSGPISPQASGPALQAIAMKELWASLFAVHSTSLVSFSWLSFSAGDLKAAFKINVRKREVNVKRTSCLSLGKNYEGEAGVAGVWVTPTPSFTVWEMRPQRRNI